MNNLTLHLELQIPDCLYLKNPRESETGNSLVEVAAQMIAGQGFETFTLKKLAVETGCTEATVYRYFENKHQLLLYIMNIYWGWLEYLLVFSTQNIQEAPLKMKRTIAVLANPDFGFLPRKKFAKAVLIIAMNEGTKIHLTRHLKDEIKTGSMAGYHNLIQRIAEIIQAFDKSYRYPFALASQMMDAALNQIFSQKFLSGYSDAAADATEIESFLTSLLPKKVK